MKTCCIKVNLSLQTTIHDLFNVDFNEADPAKRINDIISTDPFSSQPVEKSTLNAYESALAAAEDETDVTAARTAKEEAVAELAEFDENIPLVDNECNLDSSLLLVEEVSKAEQEVNSLIQQVNNFFYFRQPVSDTWFALDFKISFHF